MLDRIFGGTIEMQLQFLEARSIITIITLIASIVMSFVVPEALGLIALVMMFVWGWGVMKNWFGITAIGILLSGNLVVGVVLFVLYVTAAYLLGMVFSVLGVGRWIYLKVKYA